MANPAFLVQATSPFVILLSEVKYIGSFEDNKEESPTFSLQWAESPDDETFEIKDKKEYDKLLKAFVAYWGTTP